MAGKMTQPQRDSLMQAALDKSNVVAQATGEFDPQLLRQTPPGSFTNVRAIDDRLISQSEGVMPKFQPEDFLKPHDHRLGRNTAKVLANPAVEGRQFVEEMASEGKRFKAPLPLDAPQAERVFRDMVTRDNGIDVKTKVNIVDMFFRTPDRVLQKIGLGNEAMLLRRSFETYQQQLPVEIQKITEWADRVPKDQNRELFRFLDGQTDGISLTPEAKQVASEIKTYLSNWADALKLPNEGRITNYITHIFEKDFIQKEFDPNFASLIRDKVAGSVYDPFVQQRLGKQGYVEDTWKALDAYAKRAVRKVNMDPALERIKSVSTNMEDSQYNYVKSYIDRVNMRPGDTENAIDNLIKQVIGYKLGQRPTIAFTQGVRQMVYRGTLGINPASALKNLTQGANTYAKLGEKYTLAGYYNLLKNGKAGREELQRVGVLTNNFVEDRTINATKKFWEKADKVLFSFFEGAEYLNRGSAYFGAKAKGLAGGMNETQATDYAKKIVRDTQFTFGSIDTPPIFSGPLNKTLLQFQSFSLKQAEFLAEMIQKKEYGGLLRFSLASLVLYATIGKAIGMKPEDFIPFSGVATGQTKLGQTPPIKLAGDIVATFGNAPGKYGEQPTWQDRAATIGNDLVPLIPGGVQIRKTVRGLQAYSQKASLTPTGRERFPVEQTPLNLIKASVLGQYSLPGAREYFANLGKSKARIIYEQLKNLPTNQEKSAKWQELKDNGTITEANAGSITQLITDDKLGLGDSGQEIRGLGVADGSRANRVVDELSKLKTDQEKSELWRKYVSAKILTGEVATQVKDQLQKK